MHDSVRQEVFALARTVIVKVGSNVLARDDDQLDEDRIRAIEAVTNIPLVIHGGSGVPVAQRSHLARTSAICKFNIGTELRMAFGANLRKVLAQDPDLFDRVQVLSSLEDPLQTAAEVVLRALGPQQG